MKKNLDLMIAKDKKVKQNERSMFKQRKSVEDADDGSPGPKLKSRTIEGAKDEQPKPSEKTTALMSAELSRNNSHLKKMNSSTGEPRIKLEPKNLFP